MPDTPPGAFAGRVDENPVVRETLSGLAGSPTDREPTEKVKTLRIVSRCTIGLVTAAVAFAGVAATASADNVGIVTAIQRQARSLAANPEIRKLQHFDLKTTAQARRAIPVLRTVEGKLRHAADVVSRTHGSTATGRAGKADWVAGVRGLAFGYSRLIVACRDLEQGRIGSSNTDARRAIKTITSAGKRLTKANKELRKSVGGG